MGKAGRSAPQCTYINTIFKHYCFKVDHILRCLKDCNQLGDLSFPSVTLKGIPEAIIQPQGKAFRKTLSWRSLLRKVCPLTQPLKCPQSTGEKGAQGNSRWPTARGLGCWVENWQSNFSDSSAPSISPSSLDSRLARSPPTGGRGSSGV